LNRKPICSVSWERIRKCNFLFDYNAQPFGYAKLRLSGILGVYVNFDTDRKVHSFFKDDISPRFIIRSLENNLNEKIEPAKTLLILDEIQECQHAKDAFKYFNEDALEYHIAAAGSFLGIASGKFPVGQVNELTLYPMTFYEFLEAAGRGLLAETLRETDTPALIAASHELFAVMLSMNWLTGTGLVHKVDRTTDAKLPLSRYTEREYFKLYMLDTGLLAAKAHIDISTFLTSDNLIFNEFKGALAEQFALQELKALTKFPVFYWGSASGKAEVDFIVQYKNEIIPIEVKSSVNTKSQSLSVYIEKYHPLNAIRVSLKNYGRSEKFLSVPLYLIGNIESVLGGRGD